MKKKAIVLLMCLMTALFGFGFGCAGEEAVTFIVPDGAPALALANVMKEGNVGGRKVRVDVAVGDAATVLRPKVMKGEYDFAIIPTNMASALYNSNIGIRLVTANTYGLLYLVGRQDLSYTSFADLKGKIVHVIGQGQTPDQVLKYLLTENGVEYAESDKAVEGKAAITYTNATTINQLFTQGKVEFAVLGEPMATTVTGKAELGVVQYCDFQQAWMEATGSESAGYPQAGLVVQASFLEKEGSADFVAALIEAMKDNLAYLAQNPAEAADTLVANGGSKIALNASVVARMNLRVETAQDAKADIETYLNVLKGFNANSIGGKLPGDGLYYSAE